jgi:hypothetical protein
MSHGYTQGIAAERVGKNLRYHNFKNTRFSRCYKAKPGVLEIVVSQVLADPFRRDALSVPVRHLEKYKSFV